MIHLFLNNVLQGLIFGGEGGTRRANPQESIVLLIHNVYLGYN